MSDIKEMKDKATECAKECVDRLKNVDWKARGEQAKAKAKELASKENIDKVKAGIKSGVADLKTAEGREKLKASAVAGATSAKNKIVATWNSGPKGKAICVGTAMLLLWLGTSILSNGGFISFSEASDVQFTHMFRANLTSKNGEAFHHDENHLVRVLNVVEDGVLAHFDQSGFGAQLAGGLYSGVLGESDKVIHIITKHKGYVDGDKLASGIFVRNGSYTYETALGGVCTVESYNEITSKGEIKRFNEQLEEMAAKRKAAAEAKARAEKEMELREKAEVKRKHEEEQKKRAAYAAKLLPTLGFDMGERISRNVHVDETMRPYVKGIKLFEKDGGSQRFLAVQNMIKEKDWMGALDKINVLSMKKNSLSEYPAAEEMKNLVDEYLASAIPYGYISVAIVFNMPRSEWKKRGGFDIAELDYRASCQKREIIKHLDGENMEGEDTIVIKVPPGFDSLNVYKVTE